MNYIEISRNPEHGGPGWELGTCLWSPTRKQPSPMQSVGSKWAYWELLHRLNVGDQIIHLVGKGSNANFIGSSTVSQKCIVTDRRPPVPGEWNFAEQFYRVELSDYSPFTDPTPLHEFFQTHNTTLHEYYEDRHSVHISHRLLLFFVVQSGRLQCQNGAYLSEADTELCELLIQSTENEPPQGNIETSGIASQKYRIGQGLFRKLVIQRYGMRCVVPDCNITDPAYLICAHIARWADAPDVRLDPANGLCLCLNHDKAFENGAITLDEKGRFWVNNNRVGSDWLANYLRDLNEKCNPELANKILLNSLEQHWERINFTPPSYKRTNLPN